jgi:DNA polymerase-1
MKNEMLLIIDGSSLLSSSFYATAKEFTMSKTEDEIERATKMLLQTSDGVYTNGVYGFFKTLNKIIEEQSPSHIAVVFDRSRETTFRKKLYPEYKANRKPCPTPLKSQFKITQDILKYIGIPVFLSEEYEADDFAGSLVKKFEESLPTYCYTKDQDYLQLISENTKVWLVTSKADDLYKEVGINKDELNVPESTFEYDINAFRVLKGLNHPKEFIALKALLGDKSDNIPGVNGIGEKSATPLIKHFSNLDNLYKFLEEKYDLVNFYTKTDKELKVVEKEIKKFLKDELGITRIPINNLIKEGTLTLNDDTVHNYISIGDDVNNLKSAIFKSEDELQKIVSTGIKNHELSGKKLAYLSEKLAKIKTDIAEINDVKLDDLKVNIDNAKYDEMMRKYEMKSLLKEEVVLN